MTTELAVTAHPALATDASPKRAVVTVYTTGSACMQCALTEKVLTELGVPFNELDITLVENSAARGYVVDDLGYSQAPVVVVDEHDHWAGFDVDQIKRIAARLGGQRPE